jgi:hypothetical protein
MVPAAKDTFQCQVRGILLAVQTVGASQFVASLWSTINAAIHVEDAATVTGKRSRAMTNNGGQTSGRSGKQSNIDETESQRPRTGGAGGAGNATGGGTAEAEGHGMGNRGGQPEQATGAEAEVEGQALRTPGRQPEQPMGAQQQEGREIS